MNQQQGGLFWQSRFSLLRLLLTQPAELLTRERVKVAKTGDPQVLEGRFVAPLVSPKGRLKGLRLQTSEREYTVDLPKGLRPVVERELEPGCQVRVWVSAQKSQWLALNIVPLAPKQRQDLGDLPSLPAVEKPPRTAASRLQVCCRGSCCKRGSAAVYEAAADAIAANPALSHLKLESSGCLKECKKGPAIKLSPTQQVFTKVTSQNVAVILEEHCARSAQMEVRAKAP